MIAAVLQTIANTDILSPGTAIPIGSALAGAVFVIGTAIKINNFIRQQSEATNKRLDDVQYAITSLRDGMKETWSRKDQEIYSLKLQIHNPSLKIPDVQAVGVKPEPQP